MTRDPCENYMFSNSNKAFINFNNFLNKSVLNFTTLNCQQERKRIGTDHEFTLFRRGNELQAKMYCINFYTEDQTGRWYSSRVDLLSKAAADATL